MRMGLWRDPLGDMGEGNRAMKGKEEVSLPEEELEKAEELLETRSMDGALRVEKRPD